MTKNPHGNNGAMIATPSQQQIDLRIAEARRTQSAGLRHLVASTFGAIDRRVHHTAPGSKYLTRPIAPHPDRVPGYHRRRAVPEG